MQHQFNIIRPAGLKPRPDKYEERVAELCAEYFQSDVAFVLRNNHTTPDIQITRTQHFWEIKSIKGGGRHMIENNIRKANKQSKNVIISLLKSPKITAQQAKSRIKYVLKTTNVTIRHLLLITKDGKIIDIK